ncbi:MAG TPA: VWA domain-containing protein [Pyrinomonadaceae bacterium]|nr:VWA domain-containing protein [Pyrinomonadaceae bacterium]
MKKQNFNLAVTSFGLLAFLAVAVFAQSGRIKNPSENQPVRRERPQIQLPSIQISTGATPTPVPPPKSEESEDEVLRVESVLIPIPVSVTDQNGRAISDLKIADFELEVDGKTEEINELSRSETPVRLALLFDNSSSVAVAREFEKKAATRFLKRVLRPSKDQAALYSISTISRQEQKLTADTRLLVQAIEGFPPPAGATALLDSIVQAANYLDEAATDGRRVIVIMTDGVDTISDTTLEQAIREAQMANCQIYVVKTTDFENFRRTGRRGSNENLRDLAAERRMIELATQTGGAVYSPLDEKELDASFTRLAAELSEQYVLSYYPNDARADGKFRQISLRIPARQNLTVRTRKGYYVPKSSL